MIASNTELIALLHRSPAPPNSNPGRYCTARPVLRNSSRRHFKSMNTTDLIVHPFVQSVPQSVPIWHCFACQLYPLVLVKFLPRPIPLHGVNS